MEKGKGKGEMENETGETFVDKSFPRPFQKTLTGHSPRTASDPKRGC